MQQYQTQTVAKLYGIKWHRSHLFTKQLELKSNKFSLIFSTKYDKNNKKINTLFFNQILAYENYHRMLQKYQEAYMNFLEFF
jgi:hypothetical protein